MTRIKRRAWKAGRNRKILKAAPEGQRWARRRVEQTGDTHASVCKAWQPACRGGREHWVSHLHTKTGTKWVCESQAQLLWTYFKWVPRPFREGKKYQLKLSAQTKGRAMQTVAWTHGQAASRLLPDTLVLTPPPASGSYSVNYRSVSPAQMQVPQGHLFTQAAFKKGWLSEQMDEKANNK